jgi:hypothetical protein
MHLVTVLGVPGSRRVVPPRSTQIEDAPWARFGDVAKAVGMSRAALMRDLVLWFIRWPGAKLPKRPGPLEQVEKSA